MRYLAPIVEGHGEVEALPVLLQRIARMEAFPGVLRVSPPIRIKSGSFLNDHDYFRRYVALAGARAAQEGGTVLVLLDCEDDCPAILGPQLLQRARSVRADVEILVALAHREFETWFIAAAPSIAGLRNLPDSFYTPAAAEGIRDAKGWLGDHMNQPYDPITHQTEFARSFDLELARTNASFDRLCRRVGRFLEGSNG